LSLGRTGRINALLKMYPNAWIFICPSFTKTKGMNRSGNSRIDDMLSIRPGDIPRFRRPQQFTQPKLVFSSGRSNLDIDENKQSEMDNFAVFCSLAGYAVYFKKYTQAEQSGCFIPNSEFGGDEEICGFVPATVLTKLKISLDTFVGNICVIANYGSETTADSCRICLTCDTITHEQKCCGNDTLGVSGGTYFGTYH
jgi:hypothetical protein